MGKDQDSMDVNRRSWDQRVPIHLVSAMYGRTLDRLRSGDGRLDPLDRVIVEEVGDVRGRSLLHLQCHIGHDTLGWARRGARVTGVDFSPAAIEAARGLAEELGIDARFVCANVYDVARSVEDRFDLVFASVGVFCWIPDLLGWMRAAASMLKPGGVLYIMDDHPFLSLLEERADAPGDLWAANDYFDRRPHRYGPGPTYAGPTDQTVGETVEWTHTVGDFISAVVGAGFRVEFLHEHPLCTFRRFESMQPDEQGIWRLPGERRDKIPMLMSIRAVLG